MITEKQIFEIRRKIDRGAPPGEVKEELIKSGYTEEDIAKVFAPHEYDMRSWYLTFATILLVLGTWLFFAKQSLITLLFSGYLFYQYYREGVRLKKNKLAKSLKELGEHLNP